MVSGRRLGLVKRLSVSLLLVLIVVAYNGGIKVKGGWDTTDLEALFGFSEAAEEERAASGEVPPPAPGVPGGYRLVSAKDDLELYMENETGHIAVRDLRSGFVWLSRPETDVANLQVSSFWKDNVKSAFVMEYTDDRWRRNIAANSVQAKMDVVVADDIPDGVSVEYNLRDLDIVFTFQYQLLTGNRLSLAIPDGLVKENGHYYLTLLQPLPFFGAQSDDSDGYIFYPDGSGALMSFSQSHFKYPQGFKSLVFGANSRVWDRTIARSQGISHFPVFGIKTGDAAVMAMVDQGAYDCVICCSPSGHVLPLNRGSVEFIYRYKFVTPLRSWTKIQTVDKRRVSGDRAIVYTFLTGDDANYSGMARSYRAHLLAKGQLNEGIAATEVLPLELRVFMGIAKSTLLGKRMVVGTTFSEVQQILTQLMENGVRAVNVTLVGWGRRGYDGSYPRRLPVDSAFGGVKGLTDLTTWAKAQKADINIFLEDNYVDAYRWQRGFSTRTDVIREPNRLPHYFGDHYLLQPRVSLSIAKRDLPEISSYGVDGIEFRLFGEFLMSDGQENAPAGRKSNADTYRKIMGLAGDLGLLIGTQRGNLWTLPNVHRITDIPMRGSGHFYEEESVPFLQMVLHGSIPYSGEIANLRYDPTRQFLRQIEFGAPSVFEIIYADADTLVRTDYNLLYNGGFAELADAISDEYAEVAQALQSTWSEQMIAHEKLCDDVYKTTYSNGVSIVVNYGANRYEADGIKVEGMDYCVVGSQAR